MSDTSQPSLISASPSTQDHIALQLLLGAVVSELCKADPEARTRMQEFIHQAVSSNRFGYHEKGSMPEGQSLMGAAGAATSLIGIATMY